MQHPAAPSAPCCVNTKQLSSHPALERGRYISPFDFCFVNKRPSSAALGSHRQSSKHGSNGALQSFIPLMEKRPHRRCRLSSINSFHTRQRPGILHIPEAKLFEVHFKQLQHKGSECKTQEQESTCTADGSRHTQNVVLHTKLHTFSHVLWFSTYFQKNIFYQLLFI